ncbi:MAG TPA: UMP kinase [Oribacterium sp.]|nr:UMP kinase [Oribacterium sp.]HCS67120.1 UMP kinase [Oribacterium sp.]
MAEKNRRVMLKLSGEALAGEKHFGFDDDTIRAVAQEVKSAVDAGVQLAIVIGGGNFWRGRQSKEVDRYKADQVGILATVMNCIYVSEIFRTQGMKTRVMSSIAIGDMAELFNKDRAIQAMEEGTVIFCAGGTGHPYFSTDTGVVLRAVELNCEEILLAKAIDGVYDSDPKTNPNAKKFDTIRIQDVVDQRLGVIDLSASVMCMENHMPLAIFSLNEENGISNALKGIITGTRVTAD